MLFAYFVYIAHLKKFSRRSAVRSRCVHRKIKAEKSPWARMNKKRGPKKKLSAPFLQEKNNILAESDKGSWFDQEPLTSSATAEVPQRSNIIGASSLKIKVSAERKQDCSSESDGTDTKPQAIASNRNFESINKPTRVN